MAGAWRQLPPEGRAGRQLLPPRHTPASLSNPALHRRAVLCGGAGGEGATALSRDHKPNREDEQQRIEAAGGSVVWAGTWRVSGVLAVSRSFGNRMMKKVRGGPGGGLW